MSGEIISYEDVLHDEFVGILSDDVTENWTKQQDYEGSPHLLDEKVDWKR